MEQLTSWPTVLRKASFNEFTKKAANGRASHISAKFAQRGFAGRNVGDIAKTSARVLSDVVIIHRNGTVMRMPPATSRPMKAPRLARRHLAGQGDQPAIV